eukprot:jgi/Mesvir1/22821/Mv20083-RA.1
MTGTSDSGTDMGPLSPWAPSKYLMLYAAMLALLGFLAILQPSLAAGAPCTSDAQCWDHKFCNGLETCGPNGRCLPGTPPVCHDHLNCTFDSCDESLDRCSHKAMLRCACRRNADCGADGCCCGAKLGCWPRHLDTPCDLVCATARCKQKGGRKCGCIRDCDGPACAPARGKDPCGTHGQCCCPLGDGTEETGGVQFLDNCRSCVENCGSGPATCTGDYVPGGMAYVCWQFLALF